MVVRIMICPLDPFFSPLRASAPIGATGPLVSPLCTVLTHPKLNSHFLYLQPRGMHFPYIVLCPLGHFGGIQGTKSC